MKTTKEIFDTDLERYSSKWSHYFEIYDRYFNKFVGKSPRVLEIGVDNGGSLELWSKYFKQNIWPDYTETQVNARLPEIFGIDINPKIQTDDISNCTIIQGDQGNENFMNNVIHDLPFLDIIIDDGSHQFDHQRLSFQYLFPCLKQGGIYLIEDTHTSYMPGYNGNSFTNTCKDLIDVLHDDFRSVEKSFFYPYAKSISSVHLYDSVVVIEKKSRPKNIVLYANREKYRR